MGLQRETAGRGTMAIYVQVVFALFFEQVVFKTVPGALSLLGTTIILGSAIYVAVSDLLLHYPYRLLLLVYALILMCMLLCS